MRSGPAGRLALSGRYNVHPQRSSALWIKGCNPSPTLEQVFHRLSRQRLSTGLLSGNGKSADACQRALICGLLISASRSLERIAVNILRASGFHWRGTSMVPWRGRCVRACDCRAGPHASDVGGWAESMHACAPGPGQLVGERYFYADHAEHLPGRVVAGACRS